jgi:hypothetical protein
VRRAALLGTAIGVPLLIALIVLVNVRGGRSGDSGPVAEISGAPTSSSAALPVLDVPTSAPSAAADAACPALMRILPSTLEDQAGRKVRSRSPYVRAWGDPAVVLVCGVDAPPGYHVGSSLIQINQVQWYVDTSRPDTVLWTAVDRPVFVQVRVPASTDSASVTDLTAPIAQALAARQPAPPS